MKIIRTLILIVVTLSLNSCAIFQAILGGGTKSSKGKEVIIDTPKGILTPEQRAKKANSDYNTARSFETKYYNSHRVKDAKIAIEHFESYYSLLPNGSYAVLALLRKIELLAEIGDYISAKNDFNRLLRRKNLIESYKNEIEYIRGKLK